MLPSPGLPASASPSPPRGASLLLLLLPEGARRRPRLTNGRPRAGARGKARAGGGRALGLGGGGEERGGRRGPSREGEGGREGKASLRRAGGQRPLLRREGCRRRHPPPPSFTSPRLASGTGWAPSSAEIPGKSLFDGAGGGGGDLPRSEQPTTRFSDLLPAQARCWQAGELTGFSASRRGGCPTAPRGMPWPKGRSDRWPSSGHGFTVRWWAVASGWGGLAGKAPRFYCGELCLRRLQPGRCL